MNVTADRQHWDAVHREKDPAQTSWHQRDPVSSLELIAASGVGLDDPLIDVGSGASLLLDRLLERGHTRLSVLDISALALERVRSRLPDRAPVNWLVSDIRDFCAPERYRLWHDRALFHFMGSSRDRSAYLSALRASLEPGGTFIVGVFSLEGPVRCSGLDVVRYDAQRMGSELGRDFVLQEERAETHLTPWGAQQRFAFFRYCFQPGNSGG